MTAATVAGPLAQWLAVAAGGAAGASLRWLLAGLIDRGVARHWPALTPFPAGTLVVNLWGGLLMGVAVVLVARLGLSAPTERLLTTGLLGGFTTFSAFALDAVVLAERGRWPAAALYVALSIAGALAALLVGRALTAALLPEGTAR